MWLWLVCGYLGGVCTIGLLYLREVNELHKRAGQEIEAEHEGTKLLWRDHVAALEAHQAKAQEAWKQALSVTQQIRAQAGRQMEQELATITSAIDKATRSAVYPRPPYLANPDLMDQADLSHDTSQDAERIPAWMNWSSEDDQPVEVME